MPFDGRATPDTPSVLYREGRVTFDDIWTADTGMEECLRLARLVAPREDMHVLILGETGTGKNLLARAIHNASRRARGPFTMVNIGSLSETVLSSELFGSVEGAFTGATNRPGYFEKANGGTLFIDEIGGLSPQSQLAILTAVGERVVTRVGDTEPSACNVRIVAATNRDIAAAADRDIAAATEKGGFRLDLYQRIADMPIHLPPLRSRGADIEMLATRFVELEAADAGTETPAISSECLARMYDHEWPGNVRELRYRIRKAMLLWTGGALESAHVFSGKADRAPEEATPGEELTLDAVVRRHVTRILKLTGWNRTRAAHILGISRPTLSKKIDEYGLRPPSETE